MTHNTKKSPYIDDFCQEFLDGIKGERAPDTYNTYRDNLQKFLNNFTGKKLNKINTKELDFFISELQVTRNCQKVTASNRSKNLMRSTLRTLFTYAVSWGYLDESPMEKSKRCKENSRGTRTITEEELRMVLKEANPLQENYIKILLCTGARAKSLRSLKFSDIDWDGNVIRIENKGSDPYSIPMNSDLRSILENLVDNIPNPKFGSDKGSDMPRYIPRTDAQKVFIFCHRDGSPYKKGFDSVRRLYRRLGIKNVALHGLRKSFCTNALRNGAAIETVQKLGGWKSPVMPLKIYAHVGSDQLRDAVNNLPSLS